MGDFILGIRRAWGRLWSQEQYNRHLLAEVNARSADDVRRRKALGAAYERLFLTTESGKPVIWEFADGRRLENKQMTFPPGTGKNLYQAGDVILIGKYDKRTAESMFPELRPPKDSETSLLGVLARAFLGIEPPEYKLGHKISAIRPTLDGTGNGTIETRGLMFITDKDVVELEKRVTWSRQQLRDSVIWRRHGPMPEAADVIKKFIDVIMIPIGGLGKKTVGSVTKWGYRTALRRALKHEANVLLRRRLREIFAKETVVLGRAIAAFFTKFAESMVKQGDFNQLKARVKKEKPGSAEVTKAISEASWAFSKTLIDEGWKAVLPKLKVAEAAGDALGSTFSQSAANWVAQKMVDLMTRSFFTMLMDGYIKAVNEAKTSGEVGEILLKSLKDSLQKLLIKNVEDLVNVKAPD